MKKIAIIGAGISGLYLANLLEKEKNFEYKLKKIEKEIYLIAGKEFNIASPKQLGEIIYNELKITKLKKTKKGSLATSANILACLIDLEISFCFFNDTEVTREGNILPLSDIYFFNRLIL